MHVGFVTTGTWPCVHPVAWCICFQNLVLLKGPERTIWLYAMRYCTDFGYAHGHLRRIWFWTIGSLSRIYLCTMGPTAQNHWQRAEAHELHLKVCHILYRTNEAKNCTYLDCAPQGLCHPTLKYLLAVKKVILRCGPLFRWDFEFEYLGDNSKLN